MASVAWACTAGTTDSTFIITPNSGRASSNTLVHVSGFCSGIRVIGTPGISGNCISNAGNTNLYQSGNIWAGAPTVFVPPTRGVENGATQTSCTTSSTGIGTGTITVDTTTGTVRGTGTVSAPDHGLYIVCAGANPTLLWDYFTAL